MKYMDGTEARCGDIVEYNGHKAIVIANIDTGECTPGYEIPYTSLLSSNRTGLLVHTTGVGVVAFFYPSEKIKLLKRMTDDT